MYQNIEIMAKPIKETPVLTGKDAIKFEQASNKLVPASAEERMQAQKAFERLSSIATFSM